MDSEENTDTVGSSSRASVDILEESLALASESFDPMRVIYAPSLDVVNENVEEFKTVSQFIENVHLDVDTQELPHDGNYQRSSRLGTLSSENSLAEKSPKPDETFGMQMVTQNTQAVDNVDKTIIGNISGKSTKEEIHPELLQASVHKSETNESESVGLVTSEEPTDIKTTKKNSKKGAARVTVLTQMEKGFQQGPLSILRRSVQEKIKVRVWTRSVRNIRGISTGYVVAFDKHMNLAMMDVDEVYRKPVGKHQRKRKKRQAEAGSPAKSTEESQEGEVQYPLTPWQHVESQRGSTVGDRTWLAAGWLADDSSDGGEDDFPMGGLGNMPSKFQGMHVFEENETTRLLGIKSRKVLTRHLNQVLLRGENVVAVSLVELNF